MPVHIDLRALAAQTAPERAFLSLYLSDAGSLERLSSKIQTARKLLSPDERTHLDENLALMRRRCPRDHFFFRTGKPDVC